MQSAMHLFRSRGNLLRRSILSHVRLAVPESPAAFLRPAALLPVRFLDSSAASPSSGSGLEERGFESTTISDILKAKGKSADGSWLWCTTEDTVYDAVKSMTQNNVGALVVVKPGEGKSVAGIITERGFLVADSALHFDRSCSALLSCCLKFRPSLEVSSPQTI